VITKNAAGFDSAAALCLNDETTKLHHTRNIITMHMSKTVVTPQMAQEWLDGANINNRNLSKATVQRYASDMTSGHWQDTHQNVIAFYADGTLADGQHRLAAIVRSGVSVSMFVAYGLQKTAVEAIDQGRARSMADVMAMSGVLRDGKYPSNVVAMMNVIRYAEGHVSGIPTAHEMARAITRMSDGINFSLDVMTNARGRLQQASVRAALAVAYYGCGRDKLVQFASVLCDGMPTSPGDQTIVTIRNRIVLFETPAGQKARSDFYKMVLRFIKSYESGKILTMAKTGSELVWRSGAFDE
jgi:hypothetical protein